MLNSSMHTKKSLLSKDDLKSLLKLHLGDCIQLTSSEDRFQVIGIDEEHEKCWIRQWPLLPKGSPVFEVSMQQIALSYKREDN